MGDFGETSWASPQNFSRIRCKIRQRISRLGVVAAELPENSAKESHHAAQVGVLGHEAAEQDTEGCSIGGAHAAGSVVDRFHGFFDEGCEAVELGGGGVADDS